MWNSLMTCSVRILIFGNLRLVENILVGEGTFVDVGSEKKNKSKTWTRLAKASKIS